MKRFLLFALVMVILSPSAWAQKRKAPGYDSQLEVSAYYGWQFGGQVQYRDGRLTIRDSDSWGAQVAYRVARTSLLHFGYFRQDTQVLLETYRDGVVSVPGSVNYWQFGGTAETSTDAVRPFGTAGVGFTHFAPKESGYNSETKFGMSFGGGVKAFVNEHIGLRLQGNVLMSLIYGGGGFWCGTGGCGTTIGGDGIFQGNIQGGLVYAF